MRQGIGPPVSVPKQQAPRGSVAPAAKPGANRQKSAVRRAGTLPELLLRRALRTRGLRGYRLNLSSVPGRPDVAFTRWKVAVFVDGMFWHGHSSKYHPGRSGAYWDAKIAGNRERDTRVTNNLRNLGWIVLRFWESEIQDDADACANQVVLSLRKRRRAAGPAA
jgi:DNA mismatch endonuclease (patch repair protein)